MKRKNPMFKWIEGRQETGYFIFTWMWLSFKKFGMDGYLLQFPPGSKIPPHTDEVKNGKHYRVNIVLKRPKAGGEFICSNPIINTNRIKFFRPDLCEHAVTEVVGSSRYVLSFGWVI